MLIGGFDQIHMRYNRQTSLQHGMKFLTRVKIFNKKKKNGSDEAMNK